jgi:hypothetical protein
MRRRSILAGLLLLASPARAHWRYDPVCCADNDCQPVPDSAVHEAGDVVVIRLAPGQHIMWRKDRTTDFVAEIARADLRKPLDGRWHVCIGPTGLLLCVYPPERGF